jgi:hypothetical protein
MKKSYRQIPENIKSNIRKCGNKQFVIYSVVKLKMGNKLPNLPGLVINNDPIANFESLPDPSRGTWARRNIEGWEIVLKNKPMITKSFSHESPNFGDWALGSHDVTIDREVYQRDFFPGYGSTIKVTEINRTDEYVTIGLELDHVFEQVPKDTREFLFALNVFQEAVGFSAVRPTDIPIENFIGSLIINWEILPVGERDKVLREIYSRLSPSPSEKKLIDERMDLLMALRPRNFITGSSGFARYVGAQYGDELIAFENIRYGNAIYIMFEDWERLSRMTRLQLMNSDEKFERVVHRSGWESQVESIIREYRN